MGDEVVAEDVFREVAGLLVGRLLERLLEMEMLVGRLLERLLGLLLMRWLLNESNQILLLLIQFHLLLLTYRL